MTTHCYHVAPSGHRVQLTLHSRPGPVFVTFHGGGIIQGSRRDEHVPGDILASWPGTIVEADYRLLVPSSGHDILADVRALFLFLAGHGPAASSTDPSNPDQQEHRRSPLMTPSTQAHQLFISGFSGGGYPLRLAAVFAAEEALRPSPRFTVLGLVSYFGMGGDLFLDHWLTPRETETAFSGARLPDGTAAEQAALKAFQDPLRARVDDFYAKKVEYSDAPYTVELSGHCPERGAIWDYFLAAGALNDCISGVRGFGQSLLAVTHERRATMVPSEQADVFPQLYFARHPERIPPMLLIHGEADQAVPYAESLLTFRQLGGGSAADGKVELRTIRGADHGLRVGGIESDEAVDVYRYTTEWMLARVPGGPGV